MKRFIVLIIVLLFASSVFAEIGAYGRGGGNPLTAIKRALPVYNTSGDVIFWIVDNDSTAIHLMNDVWITADSSDNSTLMHLIEVNSSGEFVTGEPLYMRKVALTPGANLTVVNMDTVDMQGASVAAGELSYWYCIADSELVEIYSAYDGAGALDSARVDINSVLHVGDDLRVDGTAYLVGLVLTYLDADSVDVDKLVVNKF